MRKKTLGIHITLIILIIVIYAAIVSSLNIEELYGLTTLDMNANQRFKFDIFQSITLIMFCSILYLIGSAPLAPEAIK